MFLESRNLVRYLESRNLRRFLESRNLHRFLESRNLPMYLESRNLSRFMESRNLHKFLESRKHSIRGTYYRQLHLIPYFYKNWFTECLQCKRECNYKSSKEHLIIENWSSKMCFFLFISVFMI